MQPVPPKAVHVVVYEGMFKAVSANMIYAEATGGDSDNLDGDTGGLNDEMVGRHNGGLNNVYGDGHVESRKLATIIPYAVSATSQYWNPQYTGTNP